MLMTSQEKETRLKLHLLQSNIAEYLLLRYNDYIDCNQKNNKNEKLYNQKIVFLIFFFQDKSNFISHIS